MKTYLAKLKTDEVSKRRILEILEANRLAWNSISAIYFPHKKLTLMGIHRKAYSKIRQEQKIPSQVVIKAEQDVVSAYLTIRSNKQKITKAPVKKKLSMQLDKRLYTIRNGILSVTTLKGRTKASIVSYPRLDEAIKNGFQDPKLFERNGELWLAFPVKTPEPPETASLCIGVDLGIKRAAVTTEGTVVSRKKFNEKLRCFSFNKRKLQAKKTHSARRRLKRLSRKHANMSKDFTHCCVNETLKTKADVIVVEWLRSLKSKSKGRYMNRRLSQWAYGEFRRILEYKARTLGKRVVTVNPAFTSQRDFRGIPNGKRQGCRYYASDGIVFDADWNASMNIAGLYHRVSQIPVSHRQVLDGQATVNSPIACKSKSQDFALQASIPLG